MNSTSNVFVEERFYPVEMEQTNLLRLWASQTSCSSRSHTLHTIYYFFYQRPADVPGSLNRPCRKLSDRVRTFLYSIHPIICRFMTDVTGCTSKAYRPLGDGTYSSKHRCFGSDISHDLLLRTFLYRGKQWTITIRKMSRWDIYFILFRMQGPGLSLRYNWIHASGSDTSTLANK